MVRVKNGIQRHKRHKKFIWMAKGFRLWRSKVYKQVRLALIKQWQHAYENRKEKKGDFRGLWIERISAVLRDKGLSYSSVMGKMVAKNIQLNRKVLSNIAIVFPNVFDKICTEIIK